MMSFASELINRKEKLKSCQTIVTSACGKKYLESKNETGEWKEEKLLGTSTGFVVDERLDLQIAEILEYLCVSSQDPVQDENLLLKNKITHVLSLGVNLPQIPQSSIIYHKVDVLDEPNVDLKEVFKKCFEIIDSIKAESSRHKILVHCNAGYSRAPTIVIGYLIKIGYSLSDAFSLVKEKRNIKPNPGFMKQLEELELKLSKEK